MAAIQNASQAAATLYQWICSIYWYQWALREWQPAMLQLQSCEDQINAEKVSLGDRRLHSEFLRDTTQTRIRELRQKQEHQERLLQQLTQSLQAKEDASTVESSVAEHLASWTAVAKVTAESRGPSSSWKGLLPSSLSSFPPRIWSTSRARCTAMPFSAQLSSRTWVPSPHCGEKSCWRSGRLCAKGPRFS